MYDDDRDALAAEYVLGTLSADERDQAEALLTIDPGFAEIVHVWERRLGELNVMVEAVEPPPDLWDKIKSDLDGGAAPGERLLQMTAPPFALAMPETTPEAPAQEAGTAEPAAQELEPQLGLTSDAAAPPDAPPPPAEEQNSGPQDLLAQDLDTLAPQEHTEEGAEADVPASSLLPPESETDHPPLPEAAMPLAPAADRGPDATALQGAAGRWRGFAVLMTVIAAALAAFVAVTQFAPGLMPGSRPPKQPVIAAKPPAPAQRLVAVLQQEPTSPAFLLTVDPQSSTFTVRTVSATPVSGRSYELWLMPGKSAAPRSLGVVGTDEFITRPVPAGVDIAAMRDAEYRISLEPAGGSTSGAPSGPVLFRGKMMDSLPGSPG